MTKPQTTTTFYQLIEGKRYQLTMPQHRVDKVMERVDNLIENAQYDKALKAIEPFITHEVAEKPKREVAQKPNDRKDAIEEAIKKHKDLGEAGLRKKLQELFGMTYANARYYCKREFK